MQYVSRRLNVTQSYRTDIAHIFVDSLDCESIGREYLIVVVPLDCPVRRQAGRLFGRDMTPLSCCARLGHRLHTLPAESSFAAVGTTEQACGREKEPVPMVPPLV